MNRPENGVCPVCGAQLQENARFCLHCMTSFTEKTEVPPPVIQKRGGRTRVVLIAVSLLVLAGLAVGLYAALSKSDARPSGGDAGNESTAAPTENAVPTDPGRAPLIDFETFSLAIPQTAEKLDCADCFDPTGFLDVMKSRTEDLVKYTTEAKLDGGRLDLFFRNGGAVITLILSDVPENRLGDAKRIVAAVHAAVTNHYSEILSVLTDENTYPRFRYNEPFVEFFTDLTGRTEAYSDAVKAGEAIETSGIVMETDGEDGFTVYFETRRAAAAGDLYDLVLRFDYYENPEVELGRSE